MNRIVAVFTRLEKYFSDDTKNIIHGFISNIDGYTDDQVHYLLEVKDQIDRLNNKFNDSKNLGFRSLKNVDKVIEVLKNQIIDIELFTHLNSSATCQKVEILNKSIEELLVKTNILQGKIAIQKKHIEKIIHENKVEINAFLKNAGFDYHVDIIEDSKKMYSLKLIHKDITDTVTDVKNHLSFGERNAFAIVLFMYDALKSKSDLIILDDPISSFDKNKKYAMIDMLFRKQRSFKGKTVLMLTHDFEPIIDMILHHRDRFELPSAYFLENNNGTLLEKVINKAKIKTFIEICDENIKKSVNDITKIVYLRRYYEILNEKGNAYNVISNLLHKRDVPISLTDGSRKMSEEELNDALKEIKDKFVEFDYAGLLRKIKDDLYLKKLYKDSSSNYEKLHLFRVLFDDKSEKIESKIITKFINQAFHIENDYIYQLNPCEFQLVPQFVIDECDKEIASL
ncbi:MAG: hypothetical protein HXY50_03590 [Ignavibacteriaceae bacterium]|nr:hypothetical protein [Ignavibacteriaceae bacterium]